MRTAAVKIIVIVWFWINKQAYDAGIMRTKNSISITSHVHTLRVKRVTAKQLPVHGNTISHVTHMQYAVDYIH